MPTDEPRTAEEELADLIRHDEQHHRVIVKLVAERDRYKEAYDRRLWELTVLQERAAGYRAALEEIVYAHGDDPTVIAQRALKEEA